MDKSRIKGTISGKEQFTLGWKRDNTLTFISRPRKQRPGGDSRAWFYLGLVGDIGLVIAIPIVGGALIGAELDRRMSTYPRGTLLLLVIGTIVAGFGFVSLIKDLIQKKQ